jgi:hypothetical protein
MGNPLRYQSLEKGEPIAQDTFVGVETPRIDAADRGIASRKATERPMLMILLPTGSRPIEQAGPRSPGQWGEPMTTGRNLTANGAVDPRRLHALGRGQGREDRGQAFGQQCLSGVWRADHLDDRTARKSPE